MIILDQFWHKELKDDQKYKGIYRSIRSLNIEEKLMVEFNTTEVFVQPVPDHAGFVVNFNHDVHETWFRLKYSEYIV